MNRYDRWWDERGSAITPNEKHDIESHSERVASEAWDAAIACFIDFIDIPTSTVSDEFIQLKIIEFKKGA
ncbi:MAG: hypothetical protein GY951_15710 [Psychromonas sp.]|nr:hypothetical protein [Psychromonas sp.]